MKFEHYQSGVILIYKSDIHRNIKGVSICVPPIHLSPRQTPSDASQKTQKNTEHSEVPSTPPHPTPWSPNHKSSPAASPA